MFGLAKRRLGVGMQVCESQIAQIAQAADVGGHGNRRAAALEELEVMRAARSKGGRQDAFGLGVNHELSLLGMALLLAAVMPTLFFLGVQSAARWRPR